MHRIFFYLLLFLLPVQIGRHFWPPFSFVHGIRIDYLSPTLYLTDIILAALVGSWIGRSWRLWPSAGITKKAAVGLLSFVLYLVLLSTMAERPIVSVLKIAGLIKLFLLGLYIAKTKPSIGHSAIVLTSAALYSSVIAWMQFLLQRSGGGALWWLGERTFSVTTPGIATAIINGSLVLRPYATFPHPNALAGFLLTTSPFVAFALFRKSISPYLRIPIVFFLSATLILTFSRSAWLVGSILALFGIIVFILTLRKDSGRARIPYQLAGSIALVLLLFLPLIRARLETIAVARPEPVVQRMLLNRAGKHMIRDSTALGIGPNNFIPVLPQYIPVKTYQDLQPAHNTYILVAAETGIIGLGIVLYVSAYAVYALFRKWLNKFSAVHIALTASIASILLLSLFDHYFYTIHQTQLLGAVVGGFAASGVKK